MLESIKADLGKSGLELQDVNARPATAIEFTNCHYERSDAQGYVIPYYTLTGAPLPFYRLKLVGSSAPQGGTYRQPAGTQNYVYFPPTFLKTLETHVLASVAAKSKPYIIITEGEKKAAAACKRGFPTIAFSGVDSWRNKTIVLPPEAEATQVTSESGDPKIKIKLPSGDFDQVVAESTLARGFDQMVELALANNLTIFVCYDSDPMAAVSLSASIAERAAMEEALQETTATDSLDEPSTLELEEAELNPQILRETHLKYEVQRAAAALGYELRSKGIPAHRIRQLVLPLPDTNLKVGLDDFLIANHPDELSILISENFQKRSAFPRHPSIKSFVLRQLQGKTSRKHMMALSLAIITELDARGRRLYDQKGKASYYFDEESHTLLEVKMESKEPIHESAFGQLLYKTFGVSGADTKLLTWIASQYTGEQPIEQVQPRRVLAQVATNPDFPSIALQLSDTQFAVVSPGLMQPLEICHNGDHGTLFQTGQVKALNTKHLMARFHLEREKQVFHPWWGDVLSNVSIRESGAGSADNSRRHMMLLYYVSPWLLRWKHAQLPIEFIVGEAGSGKSSICDLRLTILTGEPKLRNMPTDIRGFYSGITSCGGIYAIDNAKFMDKQVQQAVSDDMCRIVTEPDPHVEQRKLYTTSDLFVAPVTTTFLWTAIEMPFRTIDLIQRSAILHLNRLVERKSDGDWALKRLEERGGRVAWLAHHLDFLHRFLSLAQKRWSTSFASSHRLAHYEQILQIAAEVCNISGGFIAETLKNSLDKVIEDADWAMEGLKVFADDMRKVNVNGAHFVVADVVRWAAGAEDYAECAILKNPRLLGRYMQSHSATIEQLIGIKEVGKYGNRRAYKLTKTVMPNS